MGVQDCHSEMGRAKSGLGQSQNLKLRFITHFRIRVLHYPIQNQGIQISLPHTLSTGPLVEGLKNITFFGSLI